MRQGHSSETAYRAGLARAVHQVADHPRIFTDPMARHFVRPADAARLHRERGGPMRRGLRAALAARSRITEDALHAAVARGVRQYVILGAGFDTFALRSPYGEAGLRVFEVDHPDTQAAKRHIAQQAGLAVPPWLHWAPADFSRQQLPEVLRAAGFDAAQPAFFAMLGVSMYLPRAALEQTLGAIARQAAAGSELVFDYVVEPALLPWLDRIAFKLLALRVARMGEPMQTFFDPQALPARMQALGFSRCEPIDTAAIAERWRVEHGLPPSRRPPRFGMGRMARAVV